MSCFSLTIAFLVGSCLSVQPAHAYLDPGTGSYAIQLATAAIFGSLWWVRKLFARFTKD